MVVDELNTVKNIGLLTGLGETPKQKCEAKGWVWDEETKTCRDPNAQSKQLTQSKDMGPKQEERKLIGGIDRGTGSALDLQIQQQAAQEQQGGFGVLKDAETGRLTGFTRGERTLLDLSPKEVRVLAEKEAGLQELEVKGQAATVLENREEQEAGLRAAARIAQTPFDTMAGVEQIKLDYGAAAMSALPGIIPDAVAGALTFGSGALVAGQLGPQAVLPEELVTVPAAAIIGAVTNVVKGFYQDFMRDLESQRGEAVEAPIRTLTETKPLLNDIINAQNANPQDRAIHIKNFERQKQLIFDGHDNLKELTDSWLTEFLGVNGINQLQEYNVFFAGELQQLEYEFADALANPDPSKIRATSKDIKDMKRRMEMALLNE